MTKVIDLKTDVTWRTLLLQAAEETRQRGHWPHGAKGPGETGCAIMLLFYAERTLEVDYSDPIHVEALSAMRREVDKVAPNCSIPAWNYSQTAASVIRMFENAAISDIQEEMNV